MNKIKVMTVIGTRPEIIRLSRVMAKLDEYTEHIVVHTGQNYDYELNEIFFKDLEIRKPDYFLNSVMDSGTKTIGNILIKIDTVLADVCPDAFLVLGDTNSCVAVLAAKRRKIPIFHMEAGNRCFDMRVPEEINRRLVDHTSDINLTYSSIAREYLLREGLPPDMVIKVGSPMNEVLNYYRSGIVSSDILDRLNISKYNYFVVSAHREENIDSEVNFRKLVTVLNHIEKKYKIPIVVSTHPRTKKMIDAAGIKFKGNISLLKPLGFKDYNKLQMFAKAVLSDSGTITEESSILNFPAINIREAHERPEGMEEASVMMTGLDVDVVVQALEILKSQPRGSDRLLRQVEDYSCTNVSDKIVRIIHSYINYVKRVTWRQS
ncbi:MAG: UDP-N-acetylglucosamine 2-epimerase (non-hydrolyzing) [Bdellovibrionales bacterium]|jgi:UDP-N-acetyl-L-fucosamine synthase|nr:UDP-N-acetylglucosamine 2-epimerase (non-hydrolyzing) [Bdellovibrionales bacterium]MBT3525249.1 UDP-N-acetylglucosamine 2-epimerase (non-hydrolyzing) [Bdellovibrionales bacterium]